MFDKYSDIVTVDELAEMLKIGRNTTYELVRSGAIQSVRVGRKIRVTKQAVVAYMTAQNYGKDV